jgi:tetratricopeptide (TPR) repeat protein
MNSSAYFGRGVAWGGKSDYDRAIADYTEAIRLDPKNANAYNNRGNAWDYKKNHNKAIEDHRKASLLDPK